MSDTKTKGYSQEPTSFKGSTKEIESNFFYYGKGMQQKCLTSSKKFLSYIGKKYGGSVKQSINHGALKITEMTEPKRYKTQDLFDAEDWSVKEDWKSDRNDYRKIVRQVKADLSKSYSILWEQCNLALQNVISLDEDFELYDEDNDVIMLYAQIQRICHGSTHHQNCIMSVMESIYNYHFIKGDDYADRVQYLEAFESRYEIIERTGWTIASYETRDMYIKELEEKRMTDHPSYKKLVDWKNTLMMGGSKDIDKIQAGIDVLNDKYKAYVYVKRAGFKYENFRIELRNAFDAGKDNFPENVTEASRRLESWRPMYVPTAKDEKAKETGSQFQQKAEVEGVQHWEKGSAEEKEYLKNVSCILCDWKGHLKKACTHDTKQDGSALNTKESMEKKYDEFAALKKQRLAKEGNALQHFMGGEVISNEEEVPAFEEAVLSENEHDGQAYVQFKEELIGNGSEIIVDLREKNHVFNQTGNHKSMNLFDILCDNQSTCDVIVNGSMVINIRTPEMVLRLQTQAGAGTVVSPR